MKDMILILSTLAMFVFGCIVMQRVDVFIEDNRRLLAAENRKVRCQIRIAAETPEILDSVMSTLAFCADTNPYMMFFLESGKAKPLLQKLGKGMVDIALLSEQSANNLNDPYDFVRIPYQTRQNIAVAPASPVQNNPDDRNRICVVWNKAIQSKDRDRVIFALENEHCRLKCGYRNYFD